MSRRAFVLLLAIGLGSVLLFAVIHNTVGFEMNTFKTPSATVKAAASYQFDPEPGCEPYRPGTDTSSAKHLLPRDCALSPFRNNPGFLTEDQVRPGDTICTHYTTLPGGPVVVTYKVLAGPFPDDSRYKFGDYFEVSPSPSSPADYNRLSTTDVGLAFSESTHIQMFEGWSQENFTTGGPCQAAG